MTFAKSPLWEELEDAADTLALSGQIDKRVLQLMRASSVQMKNWFVAVQELREEKDAAITRLQEQDAALHALANVFFHAAKFARQEITLDAFGTGVIDKAPFKNAMAAYGLDSAGGVRRAEKRRTAKS